MSLPVWEHRIVCKSLQGRRLLINEMTRETVAIPQSFATSSVRQPLLRGTNILNE